MTNKETGSLAFEGYDTVLEKELTEEKFVKSLLSKAFHFKPIEKGLHGFCGRMRFDENDENISRLCIVFMNSRLQFFYIAPDCNNNDCGVITLKSQEDFQYSSKELFADHWHGDQPWGSVRAINKVSLPDDNLLIHYDSADITDELIHSVCGDFFCDSQASILIVEDNEINLEAVVIMLRNDFLIATALTGEEAVEKAKKKLYDAVLMDINLGKGMNGSETALAVRELQGYSNIPIAAVTGFVLPGKKNQVNFEGCNFYLKKPFSKKQVLSLVENMISKGSKYE